MQAVANRWRRLAGAPDAANVRPGEARPRTKADPWMALGWLAALLVLSFIVQWPYLDACHYFDDESHLERASLLHDGELSLSDYLLTPHNEHLIPLWKLWYYVQWLLFGVKPWPWHAVMTAIHALSAYFVFLLGRRYLHSTGAAGLSAILWVGAAIGRPDSPFVWIAASHLSFAVTWLLAAMVCVSRATAPRGRLWGSAAVLCYVASVLTMGALWLLGPVLPLQWRLLESAPHGRLWTDCRWLRSWLAAFVLLGAMQVWIAWPAAVAYRSAAPARATSAVVALQAWSGGFAVALYNLAFVPDSAHLSHDLAAKALLAVAALAVCLALTPRLNVRLLVLFFAAFGFYTLMVDFARSFLPVWLLVAEGRYLYAPTLVWAVAIGAASDVLFQSDRRRQRLALAAAAILALPFFAVNQRRLAETGAEQFLAMTGAYQHRVALHRHLLKWSSRNAQKQSVEICLPDLPIELGAIPQSLERFARLTYRRGLKNVRFVPVSEFPAEELETTLRVLSTIDNPEAAKLAQRLRDSVTLKLAGHGEGTTSPQ